jgi:hypothetical protein
VPPVRFRNWPIGNRQSAFGNGNIDNPVACTYKASVVTAQNPTIERNHIVKKNYVPLIAIALLAVANLAIAQTGPKTKSNPDQMIVEKSRATWEAYKNRNVAEMKALTGEDYASNSLTGASDLKQDIATIDKLTIEHYSIDDPKVSWVTKDVAILRYKCDLKGSYDGKPFAPVFATEVWVNRGGKWQIVSYQETPVS